MTVGECDVGLVVTGAFVCKVGACDVGFKVTGERVVVWLVVMMGGSDVGE